MTVKELIEKLKTFKQDQPVLLDGYEGGLAEISAVSEVQVRFNQNTEDYYGPHEESESSRDSAVYIRRL